MSRSLRQVAEPHGRRLDHNSNTAPLNADTIVEIVPTVAISEQPDSTEGSASHQDIMFPGLDCINVCQTCLRVLRFHATQDYATETSVVCLHHKTVTSLRTSVAIGCTFCCAYWKTLSPTELTFFLEHEDQSTSEYGYPIPLRCVTGTHFYLSRHRDDDVPHYRYEITTHLDVTFHSNYDIPTSRRANAESRIYLAQSRQDSRVSAVSAASTASNESFEQLSSWFRCCQALHDQCNSMRDNSWRPTRLLDLTVDHATIRLVETAAFTAGQYMTLSHRWGSAHVFCLTRSTRQSLSTGLPIGALPQAFQDAITVGRRLGLGFLWIDSLCIMQDDVSDWRRESAQMNKVYSNSVLNISALAAKDSGRSFFATRRSQTYRLAAVTLPSDPISLTGAPATFVCANDSHFWNHEVATAELNRRAWVFQERILAPRVVHYGEEQLGWECRQLRATESFPAGFDESHLPNLWFKNKIPSKAAVPSTDFLNDQWSVIASWAALVEDYSKCALTEASDKLVAISGVAKHFADILHDEYVAGMWRSELDVQLLWWRAHHKSQDPQPDAYRAPSWSWASLEGAITWSLPVERSDLPASLIRIEHVQLDYKSADTFGELQGGEIGMWCRLYVGDAGKVSGSDSGVCLDWPLEEVGAQAGLYYVPAGQLAQGDEEDFLFCLLLQVVDAKAGVYKRYGLSFHNDKDEKDRLTQRWDEEASFPCVSYENGEHVIRVV